MAVTKKSIATTSAAKAEEPKEAAKAVTTAAPVKTEAVKEEATSKPEAAKSETKKAAAAKKAPGRKPAAKKKETVKKAEAVKKTADAKKTATTKKAALKEDLHIQYSGKAYSQEDLMKIAKDVWKYDLQQKASALNSVKLYVKPEENVVYYVMNDEFTGHFAI